MNPSEKLEQQGKIVLNLLLAAGGKIEGRTRIQKMVYLLSEKASASEFLYSYYHYGPYSEQLSDSLGILHHIENKITEEREYFDDLSGFYSTYSFSNNTAKPQEQSFGNLTFKQAKECASLMKKTSSVVLEIAATIHWVCHKQHNNEWREKVCELKGKKASESNIAQSSKLLDALGLSVSSN